MYIFYFRGYGGPYDREFEREFDRPPPSRSHGEFRTKVNQLKIAHALPSQKKVFLFLFLI